MNLIVEVSGEILLIRIEFDYRLKDVEDVYYIFIDLVK